MRTEFFESIMHGDLDKLVRVLNTVCGLEDDKEVINEMARISLNGHAWFMALRVPSVTMTQFEPEPFYIDPEKFKPHMEKWVKQNLWPILEPFQKEYTEIVDSQPFKPEQMRDLFYRTMEKAFSPHLLARIKLSEGQAYYHYLDEPNLKKALARCEEALAICEMPGYEPMIRDCKLHILKYKTLNGDFDEVLEPWDEFLEVVGIKPSGSFMYMIKSGVAEPNTMTIESTGTFEGAKKSLASSIMHGFVPDASVVANLGCLYEYQEGKNFDFEPYFRKSIELSLMHKDVDGEKEYQTYNLLKHSPKALEILDEMTDWVESYKNS